MIAAGVDVTGAIAKVSGTPGAIKAAARVAIEADAANLWSKVREKLSGGVLGIRSGNLLGSIRSEVSEDAHSVTARVWSDGSVPYARIQEYGGRIAIPEIVPVQAEALAFSYGGRMIFAKRTAAHVVDLPERSFLRFSLAEFAPQFEADMQKLAAAT